MIKKIQLKYFAKSYKNNCKIYKNLWKIKNKGK